MAAYAEFYLRALRKANGDRAECQRRVVIQQLFALFGRQYLEHEGQIRQCVVSSIMNFVDVFTAGYPSATEMQHPPLQRVKERLRSVFRNLKHFAESNWLPLAKIEVNWWLGDDSSQSAEYPRSQSQAERLKALKMDEGEMLDLLEAAGFSVGIGHESDVFVHWYGSPETEMEAAHHVRYGTTLARYDKVFQQEVQRIFADLVLRTTISQERKINSIMESIFRGMQDPSCEQQAFVRFTLHGYPGAMAGPIKPIADIEFFEPHGDTGSPYKCLFEPLCRRLHTLGYRRFVFFSDEYLLWEDCLLCIDWGMERRFADMGHLFHNSDWVVMSPEVWIASVA